MGMYGRKITAELRKGTPLHLYLPGPHRGVWNWEALRESKEIILCESLIDALTFWCAGFRNVTAAYGVEGLHGRPPGSVSEVGHRARADRLRSRRSGRARSGRSSLPSSKRWASRRRACCFRRGWTRTSTR